MRNLVDITGDGKRIDFKLNAQCNKNVTKIRNNLNFRPTFEYRLPWLKHLQLILKKDRCVDKYFVIFLEIGSETAGIPMTN